MSEQLYRHVIDGDVNFDYYMERAPSPDWNMPHGTIAQRDARGRPIGFFVRVSPYWGICTTVTRSTGEGHTAERPISLSGMS